jgi:hypothetical protein
MFPLKHGRERFRYSTRTQILGARHLRWRQKANIAEANLEELKGVKEGHGDWGSETLGEAIEEKKTKQDETATATRERHVRCVNWINGDL